MKKMTIACLLIFCLSCLLLQAVIPQKWELRAKEDFLSGKFDGVSVSFDGELSLAPREENLNGPSEEFYLSLFLTGDGVIFLGTGHGGKVYRIGKDGKAELYFQAPEMDVTCLAQDRKGILFAGTSPNGKIYKITERAKGEEFFNPNEKYIWDLEFIESGNLLAAVGESGGIYEVGPQGDGKLVLKAEENHVLCLKKNLKGEVIAGSGGGGLIYRLGAQGKASVLFESPYEEIRSLVLDKDGNIYAAASGSPSRPKKEEAPQPARPKPDAEVSITVSASGGTEFAPPGTVSSKEPGALYKINPEGVATRLWSSNEELVYSLVWKDEEKRAIFGTGNKGRVYSVDGDGKVSLILQEPSEQVYQLLPFETKIYVLANNPCRLGILYPEQRFSGEYVSPALDARAISSWGRIEWAADVAALTNLQLQTRTGNSNEPNQTWSDWSPPYQKNDEQILSPKARYLQYKILFKTQSGKASPVLQKVILFYLQTNIQPSITSLALFPPNQVFIKLPDQDDAIWGAEKNIPEAARKKDEPRAMVIAKTAERKGFQTSRWEAADENGDNLLYSIFIKKEGEAEWRTLQEKWPETVFAFDTQSFPDGTYFLRVVCSDTPSNPPGTELKAEKTSRALTIDNSLPVVKNFLAAKSKDGLDISFLAEDSFSYIEEVSYLVRPEEWRVVFPVDGICDSKAENFKFFLKLPARADNLITVRVRDNFGNIGVFRQTY